MKKPTDQQIAELIGLTMVVKDLMAKLATPGVELSVYYTLFVGELVEVAAVEGNFPAIMELLQRDAARWTMMLKAKDAEELYEIAKFTADFVTDAPNSSEAH